MRAIGLPAPLRMARLVDVGVVISVGSVVAIAVVASEVRLEEVGFAMDVVVGREVVGEAGQMGVQI